MIGDDASPRSNFESTELTHQPKYELSPGADVSTHTYYVGRSLPPCHAHPLSRYSSLPLSPSLSTPECKVRLLRTVERKGKMGKGSSHTNT